MNLKIVARKVQVNQEFTDYANNRLRRLDRFFGNEADALITISAIRDIITLELTVKYNSLIFRAEQSAPDKHDALDAVVDKIIRQIRKNKTRLEKRLREGAFVGTKSHEEEAIPDLSHYNVIKRKSFVMRPMTVEEAILQMNMLGHEFFMFEDAESGQTSVVYRRADGDYAILESTR